MIFQLQTKEISNLITTVQAYQKPKLVTEQPFFATVNAKQVSVYPHLLHDESRIKNNSTFCNIYGALI